MSYSGDIGEVGIARFDVALGGVEYPVPPAYPVYMHGGLVVGPAMGCVGELVRASVTTRLWPSQPLAESLSGRVSAGILRAGLIRTEGAPCCLFVLDDDLAQSGGKPVLVIVYDGLADVQRCLADQVFELLPATVRWDLSP